jgi:hypothetical protein
MRIALISCVKSKLKHPAPAKDLYISPLFKFSLKYAKSLNPDRIFILSAKYGFLDLDQNIEPYELTLNKMKKNDVKIWSEKVLEKLRKNADLDNDEIIFIAGEKYRRFLTPHIRHYSVPLKGMSFGNQLRYMKAHTK